MKKYYFMGLLIAIMGAVILPHISHAATYPMAYHDNGGDPWYGAVGTISPAGNVMYVNCTDPDLYAALVAGASGSADPGANGRYMYVWDDNGVSTGYTTGNVASLYTGTSANYTVALYGDTGHLTSFPSPFGSFQFKSYYSGNLQYAPNGCDGSNTIILSDDPISLGAAGTSISIIYPGNGSTTVPFSAWIMSYSGVTTGTSYSAVINWNRTNHGCGYNVLLFAQQNCAWWSDRVVSFTPTSTSGKVLIPTEQDRNMEFIYDKYTDDTYQALGYLKDNNFATGFVATTTSAFTMLRGFGDYGGAVGAIGTTTYNYIGLDNFNEVTSTIGVNNFEQSVLGGIPVKNNSSTSRCSPASDWTDIGGGLSYAFCTGENQLFSPSDAYKTAIQDSFNKLKEDFPFSMVYGTLGQIQNAAINASTTTSGLSLPLFGTSVPVLSSSSLSNFVGADNKTLVFNIETASAWVGVGWMALRVIF